MSNISDKIIHYTKHSIFQSRMGKYFSLDNVLEMFWDSSKLLLEFLNTVSLPSGFIKNFFIGKVWKIDPMQILSHGALLVWVEIKLILFNSFHVSIKSFDKLKSSKVNGFIFVI